MHWYRSWRADPVVRALADRHYSRKTPGASQFSPPGRNLTLRTLAGDAAWVTAWPLPEYVKHEWGDCWTCTIFRNEGAVLSSLLVSQAVAATRSTWETQGIPEGGFLTFVDAGKVRRKRDPGRCFRKAGFEPVGFTSDRGLVVLQLPPERLPEPVAAGEFQLQLGVGGAPM
jgi:hypothetical protein